ncbi:acyl-CoA synthetase [Flammeovirgaceae bacterium 311]|nr:acyl-CoA synthetase [Flammeovirgaceae bacterium 311]
MLDLFNSVLTWFMKKRIQEVEHFMNNPHDVQQQVLRNLLETAKSTEWGQKWGYSDLQHSAAFQERVPVSTYEELKPYIDRMMRGEQNILWPGKIDWFAKSSGTTSSRSKFIPVSPEALEDCHYKGGKDLISIYVNNFPETKIFTGKNLAIGGSLQVNEQDSEGSSKYGDISAIIMRNLPFWAQMVRSPSLEVALLSEWDEKLERMARETINDNITNLSGVPTWTLLLMERILEITGKQNMLEVWPNLEVFTHGAVSFTPYEQLFKKLIPSDTMYYQDVYNASEGFFGIQDQTHSKEMLLMLDYGVYYEFIETSELEKENPKVLSLEQVEPGKNYALIISTNGGLWRYNIGDTVKFTSVNPYRIIISGRTKHFINAFGEEVVIENAEQAIAEACRQTSAEIDNFTAAPRYFGEKSKASHEWIIEFVHPPQDKNHFEQVLDETLRKINSDYDAKRFKDMALQAPIVHHAPKGTFYRWMEKRGKLGGQNKVPRLSNTREHVEDILEMLKV